MTMTKEYVVGAQLPLSGLILKGADSQWQHAGYNHPFIFSLKTRRRCSERKKAKFMFARCGMPLRSTLKRCCLNSNQAILFKAILRKGPFVQHHLMQLNG
jgi:hypothetical protein